MHTETLDGVTPFTPFSLLAFFGSEFAQTLLGQGRSELFLLIDQRGCVTPD